MRQSLNDARWFVGAVRPTASRGSGLTTDDFRHVEGWIPAEVPGDVRLDLLRIGKIPDPFLGRNVLASAWVDEYDWWYRREVELPPGPERRAWLIFEGIDYQSAVLWDGLELGRHTGMFSRQVYAVPPEKTGAGMHVLAVRVAGGKQLPRLKLSTAERLWARAGRRLLPHAPHTGEFPERYATLKTQMSFGWDFAPPLLTCGIWDEASLVQTRGLFLRDVWAQGVPDGRVHVRVELEGEVRGQVRLALRVRGRNWVDQGQMFEFGATTGQNSFAIQLQEPRTWNPWDRGEPNLYALRAQVRDDDVLVDEVRMTLGLRTIDLAPNPGARADDAPWTFIVNGVPEFIRGANWVPADAIPARVGHEEYSTLLGAARAANVNLLRVWGGGLREKAAFYDRCDELGLLVWQEFPFAGAGLDYFPRGGHHRALVKQETRGIVRALRNHPSVVLWCGGNEFIPRVNRHVTRVVREIVAQEDGTRPFKPASPSPGESHNWRVWHGSANTRDYRKDASLFFGEFGLQAAAALETLARFLPEEELWPPGEAWVFHNAELDKLWRYARGVNPNIQTLDEFVQASQEAQLRGLQVAIEHARRNKPRVAGCAFWQFDEPWYSICWSVIDWTGRPKRAYAKLRELYNPVLVALEYELKPRRPGDALTGNLWLINDTLGAVNGELTARHNGVTVFQSDVSVGQDRSRTVGEITVRLADGPNALDLALAAGANSGTNEYDLNYCDRGEADPAQGLLASAAARLRGSA